MKYSVHDFLARSPVATATSGLDLGEGCLVKIWENTRDRVSYVAPEKHTFSLYLRGGTGTRRTDISTRNGYPGAICVMPEGCDSEWDIAAPFRFVHLYLSDARLRSGFARTHDCDARRLVVEEATFIDNPRLVAPLSELAVATISGNSMRAECAVAEIFAALDPKPVTVRAGLPPHVLRRVDEWIEANLDQAIKLDKLAEVANLSSYHFHRMFRLSRGIAPHAWITGCRVNRARSLLQTDLTISKIAAECGFSNQSHLTRIFQFHTGRTPAVYRSMVKACVG